MEIKAIATRGVECGLTKGKTYKADGEPFYVSSRPLITVTNDRGKSVPYHLHRFETPDAE